MDIIKKAKQLNFSLGEYVIVGGGVLEALGLRNASDIDIAVTPNLLGKLRKSGKWKEEIKYGKLFLIGDNIEIITQLNWEDYPTTTEEAIKTAMIIDGVPFLNIEETIKFKTALGREKDFKDVELLKDYQKKKINKNMDCVFCKIVKGEIPCHKIWEDKKHISFLSIFPNTEGFSVVTTKEHYPSYAFDMPESVLVELVLASKKVAKLLDDKLDDVGRTGLILEGFGIDHVHAKLFPMHGTRMLEWKPIAPQIDKFFEKYEGYISSHDCRQADEKTLAELAKKIRG